MASRFLTAEWRKLLMANYEVDPAILKPYLPPGTELDTWNGVHYVSLVGFMFLNTKVLGIGVPFHKDFEEVNLRFYVRYKAGAEWKRGVVFIREIVPLFMIKFVANTLYGEKYINLPMRHAWLNKADGMQEVSYEWKINGRWNYLKALAEQEMAMIQPGSEAEFITEHYWGYTALRNNTTSEYEVTHPKWQVSRVHELEIFCDTAALYGDAFVPFLKEKPKSVFLADGSEIEVRKGISL